MKPDNCPIRSVFLQQIILDKERKSLNLVSFFYYLIGNNNLFIIDNQLIGYFKK